MTSRRCVAFALLNLLLALALVGGHSGVIAQPKQDAKAALWDKVLQLAQSGDSGSKRELESIVEQETPSPAAQLAGRILSLWDESSNTYYSEAPRPLGTICPTAERLRELVKEPITISRVVVEVHVDRRGEVEKARIVMSPEGDRLKRTVMDSVWKQRFCPAKQGQSYMPGRVYMECKIEIK